MFLYGQKYSNSLLDDRSMCRTVVQCFLVHFLAPVTRNRVTGDLGVDKKRAIFLQATAVSKLLGCFSALFFCCLIFASFGCCDIFECVVIIFCACLFVCLHFHLLLSMSATYLQRRRRQRSSVTWDLQLFFIVKKFFVQQSGKNMGADFIILRVFFNSFPLPKPELTF